jgi:hypothetical protein
VAPSSTVSNRLILAGQICDRILPISPEELASLVSDRSAEVAGQQPRVQAIEPARARATRI